MTLTRAHLQRPRRRPSQLPPAADRSPGGFCGGVLSPDVGGRGVCAPVRRWEGTEGGAALTRNDRSLEQKRPVPGAGPAWGVKSRRWGRHTAGRGGKRGGERGERGLSTAARRARCRGQEVVLVDRWMHMGCISDADKFVQEDKWAALCASAGQRRRMELSMRG